MSEQKIIELLKEAYVCIQRMDGRGYGHCMHQAAAEIENLPESCESRSALQGELLLTSVFEAMQDFEEFCRRIHKAADLIGGRSRVFPEGAHLFGEFYDVFALCNIKAGSADKNLVKLCETEEVFYRLTGGGRGSSLCYEAQLAYYRGDWQKSRILAKRAIEQGEQHRQGLICICAAEILERLAKHTQDNNLLRFASNYIRGLADGTRKIEGCDCARHAEIVQYLLESSMGFVQTIPDWLREGNMGMISTEWGFEAVDERIPAGIFGAALMTRIQYLAYVGKPIPALREADMVKTVYKINCLTVDAYLALFRAVCYQQLGDTERMNEQLLHAVEMIAPDKLWLIIAEFELGFGEYAYEAVAQIDTSGVEVVRKISKDLLKKLEPIWEAAMKDAPAELSVREKEVAALLIEGKKNIEIAEALNISVRTVRTHLENIYRKKSIKRRGQLSSAMKKRGIETAIWVKKTE